MPPIRFITVAVCLTALMLSSASGQTFKIKKRNKNIPGQRAIVYDERLSALRTQPDVKAQLISRLHRDREVGIIGAARSMKGGPDFFPIAVSRNMRGWIVAEALARPQRTQDAKRLMNLIEDTKDDFTRTRLARLAADQFRGMSVAANALLTLGKAAEQASIKLSRDARKRAGEPDEVTDKNLSERDFMLNYVGLDRYNKLGVTFNYDSDRLIYDGAAYREILQKYPRSAEAVEARALLGKLTPVKK